MDTGSVVVHTAAQYPIVHGVCGHTAGTNHFLLDRS